MLINLEGKLKFRGMRFVTEISGNLYFLNINKYRKKNEEEMLFEANIFKWT